MSKCENESCEISKILHIDVFGASFFLHCWTPSYSCGSIFIRLAQLKFESVCCKSAEAFWHFGLPSCVFENLL